MMDKLLPCPFCGNHPTLYQERSVRCETVGCVMAHIWPDVEHWNRRAELATLRSEVQEGCARVCEEKAEEWRRKGIPVLGGAADQCADALRALKSAPQTNAVPAQQKDSSEKLDEFHRHEVLHAAHIVMSMINDHLTERGYVATNNELRKLSLAAEDAVMELYQAIGRSEPPTGKGD